MNEIRRIARSLADEDEKVDVDTWSSAFSQTPLGVFGSPRKGKLQWVMNIILLFFVDE